MLRSEEDVVLLAQWGMLAVQRDVLEQDTMQPLNLLVLGSLLGPAALLACGGDSKGSEQARAAQTPSGEDVDDADIPAEDDTAGSGPLADSSGPNHGEDAEVDANSGSRGAASARPDPSSARGDAEAEPTRAGTEPSSAEPAPSSTETEPISAQDEQGSRAQDEQGTGDEGEGASDEGLADPEAAGEGGFGVPDDEPFESDEADAGSPLAEPGDEGLPGGGSLSMAACIEAGGTVVGDAGDGRIHRPDYVCASSGEPPIASIRSAEGEPVFIEGAVCCGGEKEPVAGAQCEEIQCFRNIECVQMCGGPILQSSCCPCAEGSFDSIECDDDTGGDAAECATNSDCGQGSYCSKPPGECAATGQCVAKPDACLDLYDPVCGCDGVSHGNACYAALAGVSIGTDCKG